MSDAKLRKSRFATNSVCPAEHSLTSDSVMLGARASVVKRMAWSALRVLRGRQSSHLFHEGE